VADLAPIKERLAKCIRLFGSAERANARNMTERALASVGASWTDLGDWIEHSYSEDEMLEMVAAIRKESVEEGIKIGRAHVQPQQQKNGHLHLPEPLAMAEYCQQRLNQLKDDAQRTFVENTHATLRRGWSIKRGPLGYLASLYIKHGGGI
jgi:hypothetical protein